jgi:hypothetical protein
LLILKIPRYSPSLHVSSQKYNNGSSSFSATLMPDEDYCYLSSIIVTSINNQSCSEIEQIKLENDPIFKAIKLSDEGFITQL